MFVIILLLAHLDGIIQSLLITLLAVGALAVGTVAGYVWVRWVLPARRAQLELMARNHASVTSERHAQVDVPAAAPIEGGQHLHLHLPAGMSAEDVERLMRGGR